MIVRLLNFIVITSLVLSAAWVYRIKFDSTVQAERLAKQRDEVRRKQDRIATLRAEYEQLDDPARIEMLAKRFLKLQPVAPTQFDPLDHLPDLPPEYLRSNAKDPIGGMIEHLEEPVDVTGSVPPAPPNAASAAPPVDASSQPPVGRLRAPSAASPNQSRGPTP